MEPSTNRVGFSRRGRFANTWSVYLCVYLLMCLFLPTGLHAEKRTDEQRDYGGNRLASLTEKMPNLF